MSRSPGLIAFSAFFTFLVPAVGYAGFGVWPALLFLIGYFSGFVLWLALPSRASYDRIKTIYLLTFILFVGHRVEEKVSGFFRVLSEMTGVATPEIISPAIIALLILSIVGWIVGPLLLRRGHQFGYFLVWTFFASMGVTELAHFILPLFHPEPYGYFPGMISVVFLAPTAWFGMRRLVRG